MAFLSQFRVLTKILAVIGVMAAVAVTITYFGTTSLSSLNAATDLMEKKAGGALAPPVRVVLDLARETLAAEPKFEIAALPRG